MKPIISLLIAIICLNSAEVFAQMDTIWYDANWKKADQKSAVYYRPPVKQKKHLYLQVDYYMSGAKQMEAFSHHVDEPQYEGEVKWYFEDGKVFQLVHYKKGVLNGERKIYFESGKVKIESLYKDGKLEGKWVSYYENGNVKEKGQYENNQKEGHWKTYYDNGKQESEGKYVFDKKVDVWKTYYYDGTIGQED